MDDHRSEVVDDAGRVLGWDSLAPDQVQRQPRPAQRSVGVPGGDGRAERRGHAGGGAAHRRGASGSVGVGDHEPGAVGVDAR
jgi:hypothetical protein